MARAHSLPSTFDSVGLQNAPCALGRVILARNLKLSLQAVYIRRIDGPMPKDDIGSQGECALKSLDHGEAETTGPVGVLTICEQQIRR